MKKLLIPILFIFPFIGYAQPKGELKVTTEKSYYGFKYMEGKVYYELPACLSKAFHDGSFVWDDGTQGTLIFNANGVKEVEGFTREPNTEMEALFLFCINGLPKEWKFYQGLDNIQTKAPKSPKLFDYWNIGGQVTANVIIAGQHYRVFCHLKEKSFYIY